MVGISLSGSGEGPGWVTAPGYSSAPGMARAAQEGGVNWRAKASQEVTWG